MLLIPRALRVFALQGVTDMRKIFAGLVGLVETQLGQQVESGHLFLFFKRRRNSVKVLYFVGDVLVIYYRRLERGTFELLNRLMASSGSTSTAGLELSWSDLELILAGIELSSVRFRKRWQRPKPST